MPTSSQALIIKKRNDISGGQSKSSILEPCPVSNIDMTDLLSPDSPMSSHVRERLVFDTLLDVEESRNTKKVSSDLNMRGYQTMLLYDQASDSFRWKFLPQKEANSQNKTKDEDGKSLKRPASCFADFKNAPSDKSMERMDNTNAVRSKKSVTFAKPLQYNCVSKGETLACFGLRMPTKGPASLSTGEARAKSAPELSMKKKSSLQFQPPPILKTSTHALSPGARTSGTSFKGRKFNSKVVGPSSLKRGSSAPTINRTVSKSPCPKSEQKPKTTKDPSPRTTAWVQLQNNTQVSKWEKNDHPHDDVTLYLSRKR